MASPRPLLAVPNVTAHPSTASVPITILIHHGLLLCGFNVAIKGLISVFKSRGGNTPSRLMLEFPKLSVVGFV